MTLTRFLWSTGVWLCLVWLLVFLPGWVLGYLWGGDVPLWPPRPSDRVLFFGVYGMPLVAIALLVAGRSARRG